MSDTPGGDDWWQASDDKWYPPDERPEPPKPHRPPPPESAGDTPATSPEATPPEPSSSGPDLTPAGIAARGKVNEGQANQKGRGGCLGAILVIFLFAGLLSLCGGNDDGSDDPENLEFGSFDVCTQFVKERLRAPATAEFPNEFEDDGEVTITHVGETYTVISHVDSENGFGALLTTPFTCVVRHVSGDNWRLVDLNMVG